MAPFTYKELASCKSTNEQQQLIERLEDKNYLPDEENVFLSLDDEALSNMEILIGPKATDETVTSIISIAESNGIDKENIERSNIRIR